MSKTPNIMRTIAKTILDQKEKQKNNPTLSSLKEDPSKSSQGQETLQQEEDSKGKEEISETCSKSNREKEEEDKTSLTEVKEFFVQSQNKKLKLLYPTFKDDKVAKIAEQIWEQFSQAEREVYYNKWSKEKASEERAEEPGLARQIEPSDKEGDSNAEQPETKNEPVEQSQSQQSVSEQSQSQGRSTSADGRSNAETNVSSAQNDQSNHIVLPEVFALVECSLSDLQDSEGLGEKKILEKKEENK